MNSNQTAMFVEDIGTLSFSATEMSQIFQTLRFKGFGGINHDGKLGGILINTGANYWAKSILHIHSSFAQESTPRIINSLTLSTSGSGDQGDGIGLDFEFPYNYL